MKKNIINLVITIVLALILSQFLPWWAVMIAAFLSAILIPLKRFAVFVVPFLAILLLWVVLTFLMGSANDFILAKKIAVLLPLGGNPYLLILVTGLVGGIAAGISGVFGKQIALLFNSGNK